MNMLQKLRLGFLVGFIVSILLGPASVVVANADAAPPIATFGYSTCGVILRLPADNLGIQVTNNVSVDHVDFWLDGNSNQLLGTRVDSANAYHPQNFNPNDMTDGNHKLYAKAYDTAGNSSLAKAVCGTDHFPFVVAHPTAKFTRASGQTVSGQTNLSLNILASSGYYNQVQFLLNGNVQYQNNQNSKSFQYNWDTSAVANGIYDWTATIKDESGYTATATDDAGNPDLRLIVQNTPLPDNAKICNDELAQINQILSDVVTRSKNRVSYIDAVFKKVTDYYLNQNLKLSEYNALVADVHNKQDIADKTAVDLAAASAISCDKDLHSQIDQFGKALSSYKAAVSEYRKSVQKLIDAMEKT
jgi:FlaG/FlaF family flagellin (archaellin)